MVATVAEPVARRMATAISQASSSAGIDQSLEMSRIIWPTPASIRVCLKPPPAPTISRMPAIGARDFSTVVDRRSLVKPAARPSVNMPTITAASNAISGEPMTSKTRCTLCAGSSTTMSTSALDSISTTGSSMVARVAPKPGRFSSSSEARAGTMRSGAGTSTQRAAYREKTGPAMITVGMATRTPSASVTPRLALTASIATSGPGCGGIRPCITDRPASAGMPMRIRE